MPRPSSTATLNTPSHSQLHFEPVNVKSFGAVGNGVADDTAAITAAFAESVNGGAIFFPGGRYKITSTINLTSYTNIHVIGGHIGTNGAGFINPGQYPPVAVLDGRTITTGAVFYCDRGGNLANHTWENVSIWGGRTGIHYLEASLIHFNNCSVSVSTTDGNQKNVAVVMENTFWAWYHQCAFQAQSSSLPSVLLLYNDHVINAPPGLQRFVDSTFLGGGILAHMEAVPTAMGNLEIHNCLTENTTIPFVKITEAVAVAGTWHFNNFSMRNCEHADSPGGANPPLVEVNSTHCNFDAPVLENCNSSLGTAIQVTAGTMLGAVLLNGFGTGKARYVLNAAGTATAGSVLSFKQEGFDLIGDDTFAPTQTSPLSHNGTLIRLSRPGESAARHGIGSDGKHYWGSGSAAYDTTLYRNAADQLKTDDKFLAAAGIGVGNSASATTLGTLSKKMEVFDASGASLGFVPIYTTIT